MSSENESIRRLHSADTQDEAGCTGRQAARGTRFSCGYALLAVMVLVALPVRLYVAIDAAMISRDGVTFIWYAQRLANGAVAQMRVQDQHPLYPVLISSAHTMIKAFQKTAPGFLSDPVSSWSVGAMSITLVGGLLVVTAVYALAAELFDRRVAILGALLAALTAEFCQLSADALSDMPHLALYLFALTAGIHGIQQARYRWLFVAGMLSGLAFLTRPEGAEAAVVLTIGAFLVAPKWSVRQRLLGAATVGVGAALLASPYMLATGKLIKKKSVDQFIQYAPSRSHAYTDQVKPINRERLGDTSVPSAARPQGTARPAPEMAGAAGDAARAVGRITEYWVRSLRVSLLIPATVWLILRQRLPIPRWKGQVIIGAVFLHLLVLVLLIVRFDYYRLFSLRHAMILAALTLPFSAAGIRIVLDQISKKRHTLWGAVILILLVGPTLPWMLETRHAEFVGIRRTGEWIRDRSAEARIMTDRHRSVFYANGEWIRSPEEPDAGYVLDEARRREADWLVFEEERMRRRSADFFEELKRALQPGEALTLAHVEPDDGEPGRRVLVYAYHPAP